MSPEVEANSERCPKQALPSVQLEPSVQLGDSNQCAMIHLENLLVPDDVKVASITEKTELKSTSAEETLGGKTKSSTDSVKERSPTPPLKANGLRIKVGARRN